MAYIYKITNDINGKVYIGKTEYSLSKRFAEHCNDCRKPRCEKRPLYNAMNKYGVEHFHMELIEECKNPEDREIYWIQQYDSYRNGYNGTHGGDGRRYLDYDAIVETYQKVQDIATTAQIHNISTDSVRFVVKGYGLTVKQSWDVLREKLRKPVEMCSKESGMPIRKFDSVMEAAQYLLDNNLAKAKTANDITSHIACVCIGKRKTAYGYIWKYIYKRGC